MDTSDGISDADWQIVEQFAEEIAEASSSDVDDRLLVLSFMKKLGQLKTKYGRLPSILATEADYTEDKIQELSLLKEAYVTACELSDLKNISYISASLAEFYSERVPDNRKLKYWSLTLVEDSKKYSDDYINSVIEDLGAINKDELD